MKLSKFTLSKKAYPTEGYSLLYNTLHQSACSVCDTTLDLIRDGAYNDISEPLGQSLYDEGYVVNNDDDELSKLNAYFTLIKSKYDSYATMILTTYDCNMQCPYCYENSIKSLKDSMSKQTALDIVSWLEREITRYQPSSVGIAFSGGEPTLEIDSLLIIAKGVYNTCRKLERNFEFGLLTNGTVQISDAMLFELVEYGLTFIQYTIDGSNEVNNRRRYIEGGSYNVIMSSICDNYNRTAGRVKAIVRVNVDKENKNAIEPLLKDLAGLHIEDLVIDFAPRLDISCDNQNYGKYTLHDRDLVIAIKKALSLCRQYGLAHSTRFTDNSPCLAVVPRQFVIDPKGVLYKCASFAGEESMSVGSIYDEELNDMYIDLIGIDSWQSCKDCKFVPLCGGGCLMINRNKTGNYKKKVCQYTLMNGLVMEILSSSLDRVEMLSQLKAMGI